MIRIEDLWHGDEVELIKSGRRGFYCGKTDKKGKVRVNVGDKIIITSINNLRLPHIRKTISLTEIPPEKKINSSGIQKEIDLHMEKLAPDLRLMLPERIHDYQVEACKKFLDNAISHRLPIVKIIHGKGTGNLKASILHLLSLYDEVHLTTPAHQGGATEVWLQY